MSFPPRSAMLPRRFVYVPPEKRQPKGALSPQRARVLAYLRAESKVIGRMPTLHEIAEYMGWQSERGARDVMERLTGLGYVRKVPRHARDRRRHTSWELVAC
ncbi:MAG TPA: hypothetical protein VFH51_15450 [Myxococcota bacterium]|nr:hypothetical protein [Myxococcota bacterium]